MSPRLTPQTSGERSATDQLTQALHAEMLKLVTLPPLRLTVSGTWAVAVALGVAFGAAADAGRTGTASLLDVGLAPIGYTQAGLLVFGALSATSEHGGQLRTTLTSMPRRALLQLVKMVSIVLMAVGVATGDVLIGIAAVSTTLWGGTTLGTAAADADPLALAVVSGAVAYLVLITLLGYAVATVARRSLPAVGTLLGYFFVVGPLARDRFRFAAYLPDTAGYRLWFPGDAGTGEAPSQAQSAAVLALWTLGSVVMAATVFHRRDA